MVVGLIGKRTEIILVWQGIRVLDLDATARALVLKDMNNSAMATARSASSLTLRNSTTFYFWPGQVGRQRYQRSSLHSTIFFKPHLRWQFFLTTHSHLPIFSLKFFIHPISLPNKHIHPKFRDIKVLTIVFHVYYCDSLWFVRNKIDVINKSIWTNVALIAICHLNKL